jgi:excisionase family DNA binding protein
MLLKGVLLGNHEVYLQPDLGKLRTSEKIMDNKAIAITVDDVAALLSVSRRTVYRLAEAGKLRIVRITPDSPRVLRASVDEFIASCSRDRTIEAPYSEDVTTTFDLLATGRTPSEIAEDMNA